MRYGELKRRVLDLLEEGPATTYDVCAALNHDYNSCAAILSIMRRQNVIALKGVLRGRRCRPANIYCVLEQL
jgi:hypothetical protein